MLSRLDAQINQMLAGNLLLILCCVFYLLWWLIAFKPTGAVKGIKSGWLLIPAALCGLAAVWEIIRGSGGAQAQNVLIPQTAIFIGGIVAYVLLLAGSCFLLKRQVTTELFLIIGWAALTFLELDALYALGRCSKGTAVFFLALTAAAAVVSLICYLLYYRLDSVKGYLDGMVPLVLAALVMAAISLSVLAHRG
ncbi:MAG: hypothetical protein LUD69_05665 [Oscillospiraceae bacterium]|nr:hypothetical protein [Oscillospiraceae bacterium]